MPDVIYAQASVEKVVKTFDATTLLAAPFRVLLKNSVKQTYDAAGNVIDTIVPDPEGLVKAVAISRVLHQHKLGGDDIKFIRVALGMKSKDFAKKIGVTPEHMSRIESAEKVLSPQTEMLLRIYTCVKTIAFTAKNLEDKIKALEQIGELFEDLSIQSCHGVDDEATVVLERKRVHLANGCSDCAEGDGHWDEPPTKVA